MKKFCVIIPTFNSEQNILRCIKSVLNIDYENFDIIVSDNNSSDSTIQILRKIKNKKLKIKEHKTTISKTANWNRAYKYANKYEFILNVHSDNIVKKKILKTYKKFLSTNISVIFGASSKKISYPFPYIFENNFNRIATLGSNVNISGCLINNKKFKKCGMWPEGHEQNQDTYLWMKISKIGSIIYLPIKLHDDLNNKQNKKLINANIEKKLIFFLYLFNERNFFTYKKNILSSINYYVKVCNKNKIAINKILRNSNINLEDNKIIFEYIYILNYKLFATINFFLKFPFFFFKILFFK